MKYAIISDIHGNYKALELVLEDARNQGAEGFLFAGDYCVSSPWPAEVVETIRNLKNTVIICGNEENYLHISDGDDAQFEISRFGRNALSEEQREWLFSLPEQAAFSCEGVDIHMAHNSGVFIANAEMDSFTTYKVALRYGDEYVSRDRFLSDIRSHLCCSEDFQKAQSTLSPGVYIFGHTHLQWHIQTENHLFINPGSCGIPLDCSDFGAPYSLLTVENGVAVVEERRVKYDVHELIWQVKASKQYERARVWSEVIFKEWLTVREKVMVFLIFAEEYAKSIGDERRPFAWDTWEAAFEAWTARQTG